jgi:hypothetical protein
VYQHHATAACSRRDLASNLGKTAFVLSKITSVRVGSGLFEQAETLKGVHLNANGAVARLPMVPDIIMKQRQALFGAAPVRRWPAPPRWQPVAALRCLPGNATVAAT